MITEDLPELRRRAADAVAALVEHISALLVCADVLALHADGLAAHELRRSLMRATTALHMLRDELVTIEVVENYLRTEERERLPPS